MHALVRGATESFACGNKAARGEIFRTPHEKAGVQFEGEQVATTICSNSLAKRCFGIAWSSLHLKSGGVCALSKAKFRDVERNEGADF